MRPGRASILALACLAALAGVSGADRSDVAPTSYRRGPFWVGGTAVHEPDPERWASALVAAGLNTSAATVYAWQGDWDSAELTFPEDAPAIVAELRAARRAGLHTALVLRIALDHSRPRNRFLWHGNILPREAVLERWFERYGDFAVRWGEIAQREGVDMLGIGSELKALTATVELGPLERAARFQGLRWFRWRDRRRAADFAEHLDRRSEILPWRDEYATLDAYLADRYAKEMAWAETTYAAATPDATVSVNAIRRRLDAGWRRVIARVRAVYTGPLSYAANFDNFANVGFWDALDWIGINAYFPLRSASDLPSGGSYRELFGARWRSILDDLSRFRSARGVADRPILFTELGYANRSDSTVEPWAYSGFSVLGWVTEERRLMLWDERPFDTSERRDALTALHDVWRDDPHVPLAGILYWKLSTDPAHRTIEPFVVDLGDRSPGAVPSILAGFGPRTN